MEKRTDSERERVATLREYLDFQYEMAEKYGCNDRIRKSIMDTLAELKPIENINTMRHIDFVKFSSGELICELNKK